MRDQWNICDMDEREARRYKRVLRLRRERRRKCLTMTIAAFAAFCMILICAASYGSISTSANDGFKYYTSVTVEAGESLWDISSTYMDEHYDSRDSYIAEVCSINHLDESGSIRAGQTLIVPYYSSEYIR